MMRVLAVTLAFFAASMTAALAHGPTRQKVTETIEINAPVDKVWAVIGDFQNMGWHPAIEKTEGSGGNEPGAKRTLTLKGGGKIHETLTKSDTAGHSLSYEITEVDVKVLPVSNYSSTLKVEEKFCRCRTIPRR